MAYHVAWDTETARFGPGRQAPSVACVSVRHRQGTALIHWKAAKPFLKEILSDPDYILIGHNIAYDLAVAAANHPELLPLIFQAFEENRIRDTLLRQKLLDIAVGIFRGYHAPPTLEDRKKGHKKGKWVKRGYSLDECNYYYTKTHLEKDLWRKKYGELRRFPLAQWPLGARQYPIKDAVATWDVFWGQEEINAHLNKKLRLHFPRIKDPNVLADESAQCRGAWWIHLMKAWGIRTDRKKVFDLRKEIQAKYDETVRFLQQVEVCPKCSAKLAGGACDKHGMFPKQWEEEVTDKRGRVRIKKHIETALALVRRDGSRDTKAAKRRMAHVMGGGGNCRRTPKGEIQLDKDACEASGDPLLHEYSVLSQLQTVVSKDIPALLKGVRVPIHSNFNSLIATGRTSSSKPNIQNIRRLPGIRECFVPRRGMVFLDADYDGLELRTLAQTCLHLFGFSKLAEALNAGRDPHLIMAAQILNISYEEAERRNNEQDESVDDARQTGKVANFGFPGGLGIEALVLFAWKNYNVRITEERARWLKRQWMTAFPEMERYFDYINELCSEDPLNGTAVLEHLYVKRIRGGIPYTVACNSLFQGLGSDATKHAGWLLAKACYVDKSSPLYGCRIVNYIHDQFLIEAPESRAHEACMEMKRLMIEGAKPYLPDVAPTVKKPLVARRWSKKAFPVFNEQGRLIPWEEGMVVKKAA